MNSVHSVPLHSARAKIDRAKHHLQYLESAIKTAGKQQAYGISLRLYAQANEAKELVVTALVPSDFFTRFSIVAGEVISQARSALEHTIWEIVPPPRNRGTGFPVFRAKTRADAKQLQLALGWKSIPGYYDTQGLSMIKGINPAAATLIEGLQPFGPDYATNPLYILNELWNRDKHRLLNTCIAVAQGFSLLYQFPDGRIDNRMVVVPENVKDGAELFREVLPGSDVQVMAEAAITMVVFNDGMVQGKPVIWLLDSLIQFAESTINDLARTI